MISFNLEKYLANPHKKLVTRDGRNARIVCTDVKNRYPIAAAVEESECGCSEGVHTYTKDGKLYVGETNDYDLFFAPEKHEGWFNIYKDAYNNYIGQCRIFESKEAAEKDGKDRKAYIATVQIEWEE